MRALIFGAVFVCAACSGASHIPPPWELPGAAAGSAIENARYNAKRKRVKSYLSDHYDELQTDLLIGHGPALSAALEEADVTGEKAAALVAEIRNNPDIYLKKSEAENIEALTVAFMVHSD